MMEKKIKIASIISMFVIAIICFSIFTKSDSIAKYDKPKEKNNTEIRLVISDADYKVYNSLKEIENDAPIIVNAKFTGEKELKNWVQNGVVVETATKSSLNIKKVYKGSLGSKKQIFVYEPAYLKNGSYSSIEGYKGLNTTGNYVLFLRPNPIDETYVIVGMYQGKYDLNKTEVAREIKNNVMNEKELEQFEYLGHEVEQFNKLKEQVVKKYK